MSVGDRLARGDKSAQFGGATTITDFENDFIYLGVEELCKKYALSQSEYDGYASLRDKGERLPDLPAFSEEQELGPGFSIADHRKNYMEDAVQEAKKVEEKPNKFPEPEFEVPQTLLDRILVMRITDDPEEEFLSDGSTKNRRTGLITSAKYRQHSNVGIVLLTGQVVVLGGQKFPMSDFVKAGDKVTFGDYNSEVLHNLDPKKAEAMCDDLGINYVEDPDGLRVVRIQDVRYVERKKVTNV